METFQLEPPIGVVLERLRRTLRKVALRASDLDGAIEAADVLGWLNWQNNDGLLTEEALEAALDVRHGSVLAASAQPQRHPNTDWLHVISTAYDFGGHTRLLKMLLTAQENAGMRVAVAVTRSAVAGFREEIARTGVILHLLEGTPAQRARNLIAVGRTADRIALYIHPDDAGAALAARRLRLEGRKVLFVNHADHCFSYGPGAADVCLEVSSFGSRLSAARRTIHSQNFLGIPIQATGVAPLAPSPPFGLPRGPVFSIGSSQKYKPGGGFDFPAFACDLLDRTHVEMELVGPSPHDPWWADAKAKHGDRLRLLGPLSYEETSARLACASAYVDSFPMPGGTAFPQALMAGKTVFGIRSDCGGYNLADTLRYPSVEAMGEALISFLGTGLLPERQVKMRLRIAEEFNADACAARLEAAANGNINTVPPEMMAAPCALNHYINMWHEAGRIAFQRQLANRLPLRDRLAFIWACRQASPEVLGFRSRRSKLHWALQLALRVHKIVDSNTAIF